MTDPPLWLRRAIEKIQRELSAKVSEEMGQDLRVEMDMTPIHERRSHGDNANGADPRPSC